MLLRRADESGVSSTLASKNSSRALDPSLVPPVIRLIG